MKTSRKAYTVPEVADLTGWSRQIVTNVFEKEPGVLILERPEKMHKRKYRTITIPAAVYERVIRRMTVHAKQWPQRA